MGEKESFKFFTTGARLLLTYLCTIDFTFVAFRVSVHGVASIGGENLKSPQENNKLIIYHAIDHIIASYKLLF